VITVLSQNKPEFGARPAGKKVRLAVLAGLAVASSVLADEAFVSSALECRSVESADERLACYDNIVDGRNARSTAVASANIAAATTAAAASTPTDSPPAAAAAATNEAEDEFGLPPMADDDEKIDRIEAIVVKVSTSSSRKMTVELDNGQTWRQTTSSSLRVSEGDEVIIRRRSFGSHSLSKEDTSRSMKVKRVR
jgi:hypothetical protein